MHDSFYRAFEEKHRGSRELIKSRQRAYLPFIEALRSICSDARAIDLGCGRGEWLELLKESGFDAQGVDLDEGMLAVTVIGPCTIGAHAVVAAGSLVLDNVPPRSVYGGVPARHIKIIKPDHA